MEIKLCKIQADALQTLGRELNEQELQSFLEMKIMEDAFDNLDLDHPDESKSGSAK